MMASWHEGYVLLDAICSKQSRRFVTAWRRSALSLVRWNLCCANRATVVQAGETLVIFCHLFVVYAVAYNKGVFWHGKEGGGGGALQIPGMRYKFQVCTIFSPDSAHHSHPSRYNLISISGSCFVPDACISRVSKQRPQPPEKRPRTNGSGTILRRTVMSSSTRSSGWEIR